MSEITKDELKKLSTLLSSTMNLNQYTDLGLKKSLSLERRVREESERQIVKWGIQIHSAFEWLTYIIEEVGSLAKAISEHEYRNGLAEKVVSEAIQVATLALKIAEMFELEGELGYEVEEKGGGGE